MMELHCNRDPNDTCFDDLLGPVRHLVTRIDELHSNPENDSVYSFVVWANGKEDIRVYHQLKDFVDHSKGAAVFDELTEGLYVITEDVTVI